MRLDRQGPARRARGHRRGRRAPVATSGAADRGDRRCAGATPGSRSITAGPTYEDIDPVRYRRQPVERPHGPGDCRGGRAARRATCSWCSGRRRLDRRRAWTVDARAERGRDARRRDGARRGTGRRHHGGRGRRLHAGGRRAAARRSPSSDGPITLALERTRDILARPRPGARRCGAAGARRVCRRNARRASQRAARSWRPSSVDLIVANDVSRADAGFEVETNAATIVGRDGNDRRCRSCRSASWPGRILDRVEVLLSPAATPARSADGSSREF